MKVIPLTQGKSATVDDEDYDRLHIYRWYAGKKVLKNRTIWYAMRMTPRDGGKRQTLYLHREVLGLRDPKIRIDHKDGKTLDDRKENLRIATARQNKQNSHKQVECSSRFKGVSWNKKIRKWTAYIRIDGCKHHLGCFENEGAAASAYDYEAKLHFGEFALTND